MRVVTYNIWNVEGDWEQREPSLVSLLRAVSPDILALQEASVSEMHANQAEELATALEMEMVGSLLPSPNRGPDFEMGNVVLSRWPITESDSTIIPSERNNRSCVRAQVETPAGVIQVFVTHLSADLNQADVRESQVRHVLQWTDPFATQTCLLLGDFNAAPDAPEIRQITHPEGGQPWLDTWAALRPDDPGLTSIRANPYRQHRHKPDRRVDYVFLRDPAQHWRPCEAQLLGTHEVQGVYPSDHFGVCVDFAATR